MPDEILATIGGSGSIGAGIAPPGGAVPEAPSNGNAYRRRNAGWDIDPVQYEITFGAHAADQLIVGDGAGNYTNTVQIGQPNGVCPLGSDGRVPSQYIGSGLTLRGGWDAAANDPDLAGTAPHTNGYYWIVDTPGSTDLNGITTWNVGDWALWSDAEPGNWIRIAIGATVVDVFGRQGSIVAQPGDYSASQVTNDSTVPGAAVSDALDANASSISVHVGQTSGNPHGVTAVEAGADPVGSADAVQTNLTTHETNLANPHAVTAAQAGADPSGSSAAVQANLDTHTGNGTIHFADAASDGIPKSRLDSGWTDTAPFILGTPQDGDIFIWFNNALQDFVPIPAMSGAIGSSATGQTIALTGAWSEIIPTTILSQLNNMSVGANNGRLQIDYSGFSQPVVGINFQIRAAVHMSLDLGGTNEVVEVTLGIDGATILNPDEIQQSVATGGSHTTGLIFPLTFGLPFEALPDGSEISVFARSSTGATITVESFMLEVFGEAQGLGVVQRTV